MTNKELIKVFISGNKKTAVANHLGFKDDRLINYSTVLCRIDRNEKQAMFNNRKYSPTTSKIQSMLRRELSYSGYEIIEYEGSGAYPWNYGYQGAPTLKIKDL